MTTSPNDFDEIEDQKDKMVVPSDLRDIQYVPRRETGEMQRVASPKLVTSIQRRAERRADEDIDELEGLIQHGSYVIFHPDRIERRGKKHAKQDIENKDLDENLSWQEILHIYLRKYQQIVEEGISQFRNQITEITDERENRLREALSRDRAYLQTRSLDDWHGRDLVVVRLLQIYYWDRLGQVDINTLQDDHALIERYERYLFDTQARNEVTWPNQDPF